VPLSQELGAAQRETAVVRESFGALEAEHASLQEAYRKALETLAELRRLAMTGDLLQQVPQPGRPSSVRRRAGAPPA
jgi:hypothetical protein